MNPLPSDGQSEITRRALIQRAAGAVAFGVAAPVCQATRGGDAAAPQTQDLNKVVVNGRIHQSIAFWCFNAAGEKWNVEQTAQVAHKLGCESVELVEPQDFGILEQHDLVCAMTPNGMPDAPFAKGLNNPQYHDEVITRTCQAMDANAEAGFPNVIAFNGYKWRDADDPKSGEISPAEGARNCVSGLKRLARYAEKKKVTVCLEMLNTRDDTHPMKGHPGYQGDHMDYVAEIVKAVGSSHVKILFDIYHLQVMDGDVVRRIEEYAELIGHVHTAGNPGRCEIDADQEINYPACMKALLRTGYQGYVGHEYIPTKPPLPGLAQAVALCDV